MSKKNFWRLLTFSALLLFGPFIFEFLLYKGVLKEYGSTLSDRQNIYLFMALVGIGGFVLCIIAVDQSLVLKKKK